MPFVTDTDLAAIGVAQGANMVGFIQSQAGAVARSAMDKMRDVVSVADFGPAGTSDDRARIQAALNTGKSVYLPSGAYRISATVATTAPGQRVYGDGRDTSLVCDGTNVQATCIAILHENCTVENISLVPGTTVAHQVEGYGVAIIGAAHCAVRDVQVSHFRRGGVLLDNSDHCIVSGNTFRDSVVVPSPSLPQSETGCDVLMLGTSSHNIVEGNQCVSGCGVGVACQTGTAGASQFGNVIRGNICSGHPCYGIMVYLSDPDASIDDVIIEGNEIEDISGTIFANGTALFYGAGIYIQTSRRFIVSNNSVRRTNTDRSLPRTGSDTPAAIGISGRTAGTICGNVVMDAYYGIMVSQAVNADDAGNGVVITGNVVRPDPTNTRRLIMGIYVIDTANAIISNNDVVGSNNIDTTRCIFVHKASPSVDINSIDISNNRCATAYTLIETTGSGQRTRIVGNTVCDATNYGIYATFADANVSHNNIYEVSNGIGFPASVLRGICSKNLIVASLASINSSSAPGVYRRGNRFSTGAIQGIATLANGTAVVSSTEIRSGDVVMLSRQAAGGTLGDLSIASIVNGTSFSVKSSSTGESSTVAYEIIH